MSRPRILGLILLASCLAWAGQDAVRDLSGTWNWDPVRSTGLPPWKSPQIVITQDSQAVRFEYFAGKKSMGAETFTLNGRERPRYSNQIEKTFVRAHPHKGDLVVETRAFLENDGTQSYVDTETWSVSKDGDTLTEKTTDGKVVVYRKQKAAEEKQEGK